MLCQQGSCSCIQQDQTAAGQTHCGITSKADVPTSAMPALHRGTADLSVGVAPHAVAGDLHLPRSTLEVQASSAAASSSRPALSQLQTSGPASTSAAASPSGTGAGPPRQPTSARRDDTLDDTFIDVRADQHACTLSGLQSCMPAGLCAMRITANVSCCAVVHMQAAPSQP